MRATISLAFLVGGSLALVACGRSAAGCDPSALIKHSKDLDELRALNPINAATDAERAYARGNARLIGVYGFAVEVPGYDGDPYAHKADIRMLDGTDDAYCTKEEAGLNHSARVYARRYNEVMLSRLKRAAVESTAQPTR